MKLAGIKTGLLINFNVTKLKDSIKRYVLWPLRALRVLRGVFRPLDQKNDGCGTLKPTEKRTVLIEACSEEGGGV